MLDLPKTRKEAFAAGSAHYFTGKSCKHGHISKRYTKDGSCFQCAFEQCKKWKKDNKERSLELNRLRYWKDPESGRAKAKKWRDNNPEKWAEVQQRHNKSNEKREYLKRWKVDNSQKEREYLAHRRALKRNATPSWMDREEVRYIYALATEKGLVVDHMVPLISDKVCGLHVGDNLRCIPEGLNLYKGNKYWPDMWEPREVDLEGWPA